METILPIIMPILIQYFLPVLGTILAGLLSWGLAELAKFIRVKTRNENTREALLSICDLVDTTVAELEQTMVPVLKQKTADGKLTAGEAEELKATAVDKIRSQLPAAMETAARLSVNSINRFIEANVERAVLNSKNSFPATLIRNR